MSKILFIGDLNQYGRGYQRYRTLLEMGHEVVGFSHTDISAPGVIEHPSLTYRLFWKLRFPLDTTGVNAFLRSSVSNSTFDVIWIEKGNMIRPATLVAIKKMIGLDAKVISCSEDDMYARHGHSYFYRLGLRHYHCVFTTKTYNLTELKTFGAQETKLFLDSYDEVVHRPVTLSREDIDEYSCDVGAIGAFEEQRARSLLFLARNGIEVNIWGNGWGDWVGRHPLLRVRNKFLFGLEYAKAISATKVNLNFLRKINRDEVTSRSVEIPACRGFMLAERTQRHQSFFKEGEEAEFFDSNEELLMKTEIYLREASRRRALADAGFKRCLISGYSMRSQLSNILNHLGH